MSSPPAYASLHDSGELNRRVRESRAVLESCRLCPRECGANRLKSELGRCCTGPRAIVASYGSHFGEEAPLVGSHGSGTIFFAYCNLNCVFCQNYSISQRGEGAEVDADELAAMMLSLQRRGCHNINLVTPTHVVPQILEAVILAVDGGLDIPLVYNCGGYESVETLKLLDGVVDIYMPDMKYSDNDIAWRYSGVENYADHNRAAVREMYRQVGDLELDQQGVATRGLLVRHLVLPQGLAGTREVVRFLADEVSRNTYLNIMAQYHPAHRASDFPPLKRSVTMAEITEANELALRNGLRRLDSRPARSARVQCPW
jgi:putative pyruvate formate lyase activating enzyme